MTSWHQVLWHLVLRPQDQHELATASGIVSFGHTLLLNVQVLSHRKLAGQAGRQGLVWTQIQEWRGV